MLYITKSGTPELIITGKEKVTISPVYYLLVFESEMSQERKAFIVADTLASAEGVGDQFVDMKGLLIGRGIDQHVAEQLALFVPNKTVVVINVDGFMQDIGRRNNQGVDIEQRRLPDRTCPGLPQRNIQAFLPRPACSPSSWRATRSQM